MNSKSRSFINIFIIFMLSALLFSGCAKDIIRGAPERRQVSFVTDVDYVGYIEKRLDGLKTFKAGGNLKISNSKKSDSATSAILIKRPDSLRLESYSAFGQSVFFFTSKKDTFSIFVPKENKYFTGSNTLANLKKVLPLDVTIDEFTNYLIGDYTRGNNDNVVIKFLEDKKVYKIYFQNEEQGQKVVWFDPEMLTVTKCAVYDDYDALKSIATYSDFKEIAGFMFPMTVTIKFPEIGAKINVEYDDIIVNEEMKEEIFSLKVPKKAVVVNLDSKGK